LERHVFNPKKKYHYNGDVYIIQGGYTFSASTMFVNSVKDQKNVIVTGEESGGGSYGNSAVHLPTITLPNSRIRITLPLFRVVFSEKNQKTGRGIFPEINIQPSIDAIRGNYDVKLKTVQDLIQSKSIKSTTLN
jgi:C-terminal processing protease CtpA/Prc